MQGRLHEQEIERAFRERPLSPEEVASDRRKAQAEFPPAAPSGSTPGRLSQALKEALRTSGKSMYQIAQDAGVSPIVVSRFLCGERDIRMATADKLADALGMSMPPFSMQN